VARDFDGANDEITFGSNATIDGFALRSWALWVIVDALVSPRHIIGKCQQGGQWGTAVNPGGELETSIDWDTTNGSWITQAGDVAAGAIVHLAQVYDQGAAANDPVTYLNGTALTYATDTNPTGNPVSDAASSLFVGEACGTLGDLDGKLGHVCYNNTLWTAADVNRARWWGVAPGGPSTVAVWQPMWTTDLNNRGTATANGTATGTTMNNAALPRVERCWGSMMGCGR
jgi:hypothetical protein